MAGTSAGARKGWETRRRGGTAAAAPSPRKVTPKPKKVTTPLRAAPITTPLRRAKAPKSAPRKITPNAGPDIDTHNPYAKPDAYTLLRYYGREQYHDLLEQSSMNSLRDMMVSVQKRNPGTKPKRANSKAGMIEYIERHVLGGR